jgi:Fe-S-cluster-containing hydrogenase component 2
MIELVSETRCILSNKCVQVCPVDVFSSVKRARRPLSPARTTAQACFLCELYRPADALCVAPPAKSISRRRRAGRHRQWPARQLPRKGVGCAGENHRETIVPAL